MIVFVVIVFFFAVVILKHSIASWLGLVHFEYRLRALGERVVTSSWVEKYAGASKMKLPLTCIIAIPTPWNLDFSPFANVQLIVFYM